MATDDLESRVEEAFHSWERLNHGNPGNCEWGFFSYSDAPPAIGGGIGMFVWFPDRNAMLDFISKTLPSLDPDEIARNTHVIVEKLRQGTLSHQEGVEQLNKALATCFQLDWIGTVHELLTGNHPYVVHVRQAFRDDDEDEVDGGPIGADEKEEFFEFLETWGL